MLKKYKQGFVIVDADWNRCTSRDAYSGIMGLLSKYKMDIESPWLSALRR
jgi:hypothetical protein